MSVCVVTATKSLVSSAEVRGVKNDVPATERETCRQRQQTTSRGVRARHAGDDGRCVGCWFEVVPCESGGLLTELMIRALVIPLVATVVCEPARAVAARRWRQSNDNDSPQTAHVDGTNETDGWESIDHPQCVSDDRLTMSFSDRCRLYKLSRGCIRIADIVFQGERLPLTHQVEY